jgi:hypothetical protein
MSIGVQAKQVTASGLITDKRALFKQVLIFSSVANDSVIEFYDRTTAPTGGEPHYHLDVYGKGNTNIPFVAPGVLFDDGIYVVIPISGITVSVIYEEL